MKHIVHFFQIYFFIYLLQNSKHDIQSVEIRSVGLKGSLDHQQGRDTY